MLIIPETCLIFSEQNVLRVKKLIVKMSMWSLAMTERMDIKASQENARVFHWENVMRFQQKNVWQWMIPNVTWFHLKSVIKWTQSNVIRFQTRSDYAVWSRESNFRITIVRLVCCLSIRKSLECIYFGTVEFRNFKSFIVFSFIKSLF